MATASAPALEATSGRGRAGGAAPAVTGPTVTEPTAAVAIASGSEAGRDAGSGPAPAKVYPGTGTFTRHPRAAESAEVAPDGHVSLNFVDADIREVAKTVLGDILKLNYAIDPRIQGMVTVQTSRALPRTALLSALETILQGTGAALVRSGDLYKIVPVSQATRLTGGVHVGTRRADRGRGFAIQIVPLKYVAATEMAKILQPLGPKGSVLRIDPRRNLLILGASRPDLDTMLDAVNIFDVDWLAGMSFGLFPLEFADAKTMAAELGQVFEDQGQGRPLGLLRFVPIERLNAVLVITPRPAYLRHAETWIKRLDRGSDKGGQRLAVYYIKNGKATELATILGKLFAPKGAAAAGGGTGGGVAPHLAATEISTEVPAAGGAGQSQGGSQGDGKAPTIRSQTIRLSDTEEIRIIADEANNALVVLAAPAHHKLIKAALAKLDIVPLQVLIEATIAEVTLNDQLRYGLQWFFKKGSSEFNFSELATGAVTPPFPGFSYFFNTGNIKVVLDALSQITDVNVISSPQVMVLGNKTATLKVGDQVPIATQSAVSVTDPSAPIVNSIQFRDTGVILRVTPRVNPGGLVIMDIAQEVSDVVATTTSGIDSPTIQQRQINSTVVVQSGETVALGGLIRESHSKTKTGIPVLSDIPVLGALFGTRSNLSKRTELLVLITPRVIRNQEEARSVTQDLRQRMQALAPLNAKIGPYGPLRPKTEPPAAKPPKTTTPKAATPKAAPSGSAPPKGGERSSGSSKAGPSGTRTPKSGTPKSGTSKSGTSKSGDGAAAHPGVAGRVKTTPRPARSPSADSPSAEFPPPAAPAPGRPRPHQSGPAPAAGLAAMPAPLRPRTIAFRPEEGADGSRAPATPASSAAAVGPGGDSLEATVRPAAGNAATPARVFVQAGAYTSKETADHIAATLARLGPVAVTSAVVNGTRFFRVRLGPLGSVEAGETLRRRAAAAGFADARLIVF